jgi:hypothetical protein
LPRRVARGGNIMGWSIADVFGGGVIYTRVAWAMELTSAWLGLEPGRKSGASPRLAFWAMANDTTRSEAIRRLVELGLKKGK